MKPKLTKDKIMHIAKSKGAFSIHRFKYSQSYLKSKCKELTRCGKLVFNGISGEYINFKVGDK